MKKNLLKLTTAAAIAATLIGGMAPAATTYAATPVEFGEIGRGGEIGKIGEIGEILPVIKLVSNVSISFLGFNNLMESGSMTGADLYSLMPVLKINSGFTVESVTWTKRTVSNNRYRYMIVSDTTNIKSGDVLGVSAVIKLENGYLLKSDATASIAGYDATISTGDRITVSASGITVPEKVVETQDMHRLYNPNSGEHFYTASIEERDNLVAAGWQNEGVAWKAPVTSNTPVYRLFNPNGPDHHYTISEEERDNLVNLGWQLEGIGWYSDDAKGVPLHRLYNPNANAGSHHYTTSVEEKDNLVSIGWIYEGEAWYGVASQIGRIRPILDGIIKQ